jgi:import receptor subunit TOM22
LAERLWGLTEMFPEPVRDVFGSVVGGTTSLSKTLYSWSRTGLWVVGSSFTILVLPIICEQERSNLEEQQAAQQRELLLGPSAAVSSPSAPAGPMGFGYGPK